MRARLLLLAAALAAFGLSLGSGFHFDDYAIFSGTSHATRPLTFATFWLNQQIGGADPVGYHAVNLALHIAAVLLLYECLRRLMSTPTALLAAAIFAVHPMQAESVDYVWGRSIVLAAALCLASMLSWITGRRWAAVAWFVAALLAKEEVAAFPLVLWLFEKRRRPPVQIPVMLAASLAAGVHVIYAAAVTPGSTAGVQAGITPWHYFLAQGPVIWRYLRLLIIPYGFTVDPQITVPPVWLGLAAWAALAVIVEQAVRLRRAGSPPWLLAGLLLLLPSSSIFPAADLAADRRIYLPLMGFATAAALSVSRLRWKPLAPAIVIALTAIAFTRTQVWMTEESLWQEAVRRAPEKVRPKIQLARQLPPREALTLLADARRLAPGDPAVAAETGKVLLSDNRPAEALAEFGRALALDPRDARNYNNRGVALQALGQTDAARQDFERALKLDPGLAIARDNLARITASAR